MFSFLGNLEFATSRLNAGSNIAAINANAAARNSANPLALPRSYANSTVMFARAQANTIYTQPGFYSPIHTPQNWQMPGKRREVYQWCRYWYDNEPKVGSAIDFYSAFPMNGFETQCDDSKVKLYFDNLNKKFNMDYWCIIISKEMFMLGDVFPFTEIICPSCGGGDINERGEICDHPGGRYSKLTVLNPDTIDVQNSIISSDEPIVTMLPDDTLKRIVWTKTPRQHYDKIPELVRNLILAGRPIPLSSNSVSHLKYNASPYSDYGQSIIKRLFKTLAYKDKLMTAQWIVADRLILPIRIVKVGDSDRPAGAADIADIQNQLAAVAKDPNFTLVTHHAVDYDWYGTSGKVLQLSNEYELINKEILQGLMINEALLSGEMSGYQGVAIGAEFMVRRLETWRTQLARWIEDKIYKRIARMKALGGDDSFVDKEATKELEKLDEDMEEPVYKIPKIKWNDMNVRDAVSKMQIYMQLHDKQVISTESLCEHFGFDYDHELQRIRYETAAQQFSTQAAGPGGGMGGGMGMDMGMGGGDMGGGAPPDAGIPGGPGPGGAPGQPTPMPDAGMGGAPAPGGAAAASSMGGSQGKVMSKGRASKQAPQEEAVQPTMVRLTSLEQIMYKNLLSIPVPFKKWIQFPLGKYKADFAIPAIKLAIECDGDYWHQQAQAKAHDQMRDKELASYGWQVLRFSEDQLKQDEGGIRAALAANIKECWMRALKNQNASFGQLKQQASKKNLSLETERTTTDIVNSFFRVSQLIDDPDYPLPNVDNLTEDRIVIVSFEDRMKEKFGA